MLLAIDRSIQPASYFVEGGDVSPKRPFEGGFEKTALPEITRVAVAIGPGSFSGIRSALAFANGFSLPAGTPVIGIPTPAAIWRAWQSEHPDTTAGIVIGDARRGKLWYWIAEKMAHGVPPCLASAEEVRAIIGRFGEPSLPVITPDHARLAALFPEAVPAPPIARAVAELALEGLCLPPLPVYLSEAV